jgi:hypothetical protein
MYLQYGFSYLILTRPKFAVWLGWAHLCRHIDDHTESLLCSMKFELQLYQTRIECPLMKVFI